MNVSTAGNSNSTMANRLAQMACINATTNARLNGLEPPNCLPPNPMDIFTPSGGETNEFPTFNQLNNARFGGGK